MYANIVEVLKAVQKNNSREWYMENKAVFGDIHSVLSELYSAVGCELQKKAEIDMNPRKSISRPYNDQRFGNKPYLKDCLWVTFQANAKPVPAFFIEFSLYGIRCGMGYYSATPVQMQDMRAKIDDNPLRFSDMIENVLMDKDIQIIGEQYKRRIASDYEGLLEEIYNYKSIYFQKIIPINEWEQLEDIVKDTFFGLVPLYEFMVR